MTTIQHVDFVGKPIKLGDLVVFNSAGRYKRLHVGRVVKITLQRILVHYYYTPMAANSHPSSHITPPNMVMKVERANLPSNIQVPE